MSRWVVLGKPECPWCEKVSELLHSYGIEFVYMNTVGNELTHFLINCGLKTVPQVFEDGELIGGYEDTKAFLEMFYDVA